MRHTRIGDTYIVRLDRGEEVVETLRAFCWQQQIRLGTVTAIGAVDELCLALYDPIKKEYYEKEMKGNFEVAPLSGSITTMADEPYLHLHVNVGDEQFNSYAGHLKSATVSSTLEVFIRYIDGQVERYADEEIGLNLLDVHDTQL